MRISTFALPPTPISDYARIFKPIEVFSGITKGLIEQYGRETGITMAKEWFKAYKKAVLQGKIEGEEFMAELDNFLSELLK